MKKKLFSALPVNVIFLDTVQVLGTEVEERDWKKWFLEVLSTLDQPAEQRKGANKND